MIFIKFIEFKIKYLVIKLNILAYSSERVNTESVNCLKMTEEVTGEKQFRCN